MSRKLLVLGIDAFDPRVIDYLWDSLPNFQGLDVYRRLETTIPPETPVAWSAASSGCNPGKFGIFDFIGRDKKTYRPQLMLSEERAGLIKTTFKSMMRGVAYWDILNTEGIETTVIRWPVTFPASKIRGRMLSGLGVVDIKGMLNSYRFYTEVAPAEDSEAREKAIIVDRDDDNRIETYLPGPFVRGISGLRELRIRFSIEICDRYVVLSFDKMSQKIRVGEWSDIVRVKYQMGRLLEIYGICQFYLISIEPFKMYVSSVQIDPCHQFVPITYPVDYGRELAEELGLFYTLGMPEDTKAVNDNILDKQAFLGQVMEIERQRTKMFYYELNRFKRGVLSFVFDEGDRLQHIFWENCVLDGSDEFVISEEIREYYFRKDRLIGDILSYIDRDTSLIIISDHGFSSFERAVNINNWLVEEGFMVVRESKTNSLFDFVDWDNTVAYSLGFFSIYINQKDRESHGIVSRDDKEDVMREIIQKLSGLRDSGRRVFNNIYAANEIYSGKYIGESPDIILGFSEGYRMSWKNAVGGLDEEIISVNQYKWKGDHLIDRVYVPGVIFTNFDIDDRKPSITDIAPTVLDLLNVKIPDWMDGKSLVI